MGQLLQVAMFRTLVANIIASLAANSTIEMVDSAPDAIITSGPEPQDPGNPASQMLGSTQLELWVGKSKPKNLSGCELGMTGESCMGGGGTGNLLQLAIKDTPEASRYGRRDATRFAARRISE
ncbi:hypothetical protein ACJ73_06447 [Blastomyces percursus]|uniref:Uncharacterized protein n=1 Tax=Blastomyces percursus TaxID=1658174 RepID=A0A1J9Q0Q8_9EURO|nr:hypothetical protein ACJ73_06447 [Blastomyces percursus]